jgi:hypothetical protein
MASQMANGILHAAQGRLPENVLNPSVLSRPGFQAKLARFSESAVPGVAKEDS